MASEWTAKETASRLLRSSGASTFSQLWRVGVSFATHLLLRRWVSPEEWGLFDWTGALFLVLGAVRDLGLPYHVIRVRPRPFANLLAIEAIWGSVLVLLAYGGAPLLAQGFATSDPRVVPVVRAFTLFFLFEGLATVPKCYFESELKLGRAVLPEVVRNLCFALTAVALAANGLGLWSLVLAHVGAAATYAILMWWRAWGSMPLTWADQPMSRVLGQSLPLALVWFLSILVAWVDRFILGAMFPAQVVGVYGFAYYVAFLASNIIVAAVARPLYPALVAFAKTPHRMFETYRLANVTVLAFEVPTAIFLFLNSTTVLTLLGGGDWVAAGADRYLMLLCFAPLVDPVSRLGGEVLKTMGQDRYWLLCSGLTLLSFLGLGLILTQTLGPLGMAVANFFPLGALVMAWRLYRLAPRPFRRFLGDLLVVYSVPLPLLLLTLLVTEPGTGLRLGLSLAAAAACAGLYVARFGGAVAKFLRGDA